MIGKGNPQWPHAFYTRIPNSITLEQNDEIYATCRYYNSHDQYVGVGSARGDEMCNFYMMYSTKFRDGPLESLDCWGFDTNRQMYTSESINKISTVNDTTPYPGYAGVNSEEAINYGGWPMPSIPDEMQHSMTHEHHHDMGHDMGHDSGHDMGQDKDNHDEQDGELDDTQTEYNIDDNDDDHDDDHNEDDDDDDVTADYTIDDFMEDEYNLDDYMPEVENDEMREEININFEAVAFDSTWSPSVKLGEVAGVDTDVDGTVWVFHRGDRTWNEHTFDYDDNINNVDPIEGDVVFHLDGNGTLLHSWGGQSHFLLPHGITVTENEIWLTDVGTHQIYKYSKNGTLLMTLGKVRDHANTPDDTERFCKPADVYIDPNNRDIYVADGYCNTRVARFDTNGHYINSITNKPDFAVVHDIAQGPGAQILISDRENGKLHVWDKALEKIVKTLER